MLLFVRKQLLRWQPTCRRTWVRTCRTASWRIREGDSPLQTGRITIEVVLVSGGRTRIGVLPESVVTPSIGQSADAARVVSDPQWTVRGERGAVPGTLLPPIGGGVDHRIAMLTGMVGVGEIADPANHRSIAQTIASGTRWVVCPIDGRSVGEHRGWRVCDPYIRCRGHPEGSYHRHSNLHRWRRKSLPG
jgi:hypothetical protein